MKRFIAVYGTYSRHRSGHSNLTYKTVNTPDHATLEAVEKALENTSDGPYTEFIEVLDLNGLQQIDLEATEGLKVK